MQIFNRHATYLLVLSCLGCANAAEPGPSNNAPPYIENVNTRCAFGAFVTESDPAGLNVRQSPGLSGKIIGKLPPVIKSHELDGYKVKIEVDILGSKDGWFLITGARDNPELTGKPARPVFSGTGWVSGSKLGVKSQASHGYAQPNAKAVVALEMEDEVTLDTDSVVEATQLIACLGEWAQVDIVVAKVAPEIAPLFRIPATTKTSSPPGRIRVWLNQLCGIQETACSGLADQAR